MKHALISAEIDHRFDPPAWETIKQMEGRIDSIRDADVIGLVITKQPNFRFRDSLPDEIKEKKWVLYNWVENGWNWDQSETMTFGKNTESFFGSEYSHEWNKFDSFVRDNPPILTFQRELLQRDRTDRLIPIEYLNWLPDRGASTKDNFIKRPVDVLYNWGRSSEYRMMMQAAIFVAATKIGFDVITEWKHLELLIRDNPSAKKWMAIHAPHFARIDVKEVQEFAIRSKISLLVSGCGIKLFRSGEVCMDGVLAMQKDDLAWSYPWDESNCIRYDWPSSIESCLNAIDSINTNLMDLDALYERYLSGVENGRNYRPENYHRRWIKANIEKYL